VEADGEQGVWGVDTFPPSRSGAERRRVEDRLRRRCARRGLCSRLRLDVPSLQHSALHVPVPCSRAFHHYQPAVEWAARSGGRAARRVDGIGVVVGTHKTVVVPVVQQWS